MLSRLGDGSNNRSITRDGCSISNRKVTGKVSRAPDDAEVPYLGTARNCSASRNNAAVADRNIVGNLNLIIDFATRSNDRIAHRTPVNRR